MRRVGAKQHAIIGREIASQIATKSQFAIDPSASSAMSSIHQTELTCLEIRIDVAELKKASLTWTAHFARAMKLRSRPK